MIARLCALLSPGRMYGALSQRLRPPSCAWYQTLHASHRRSQSSHCRPCSNSKSPQSPQRPGQRSIRPVSVRYQFAIQSGTNIQSDERACERVGGGRKEYRRRDGRRSRIGAACRRKRPFVTVCARGGRSGEQMGVRGILILILAAWQERGAAQLVSTSRSLSLSRNSHTEAR